MVNITPDGRLDDVRKTLSEYFSGLEAAYHDRAGPSITLTNAEGDIRVASLRQLSQDRKTAALTSRPSRSNYAKVAKQVHEWSFSFNGAEKSFGYMPHAGYAINQATTRSGKMTTTTHSPTPAGNRRTARRPGDTTPRTQKYKRRSTQRWKEPIQLAHGDDEKEDRQVETVCKGCSYNAPHQLHPRSTKGSAVHQQLGPEGWIKSRQFTVFTVPGKGRVEGNAVWTSLGVCNLSAGLGPINWPRNVLSRIRLLK